MLARRDERCQIKPLDEGQERRLELIVSPMAVHLTAKITERIRADQIRLAFRRRTFALMVHWEAAIVAYGEFRKQIGEIPPFRATAPPPASLGLGPPLKAPTLRGLENLL